MAMTKTDTLNYRGELLQIGGKQTPFLNLIAGRSRRSGAFLFPLAQTWNLAAASQPAISEDDSVGTLTPTTTARSEATNTVQIFQNTVQVSLKKQSTSGFMSGINTNDPNPVVDELTFQKNVQLKQMALDMEYAFLNGVYANATTTATAAKTRGIITGITTNTVAAAGAALTKPLIDKLLRTMADNGSPFTDPVIFVNGYQKQQLSHLYEYVPQSRTVGGANIQLIETDFAQMGVVYDPQIPAGTLLIADISVLSPVYVPIVPLSNGGMEFSMDGAEVLWQPTAVTAAAYGGYMYSQCGIDYSAETYHGTLTGLATA